MKIKRLLDALKIRIYLFIRLITYRYFLCAFGLHNIKKSKCDNEFEPMLYSVTQYCARCGLFFKSSTCKKELKDLRESVAPWVCSVCGAYNSIGTDDCLNCSDRDKR